MTEKTINLLGIRKKAVLSRFKKINSEFHLIMLPLTDEQEIEIEENDKLGLKDVFIDEKGNNINKSNIYFYGELNMENDNDLNYIEYANIINNDFVRIPININYKDGIVTTVNGIVKYYDTNNPFKWFRYNHLLIGKPKKIIVFKRKI